MRRRLGTLVKWSALGVSAGSAALALALLARGGHAPATSGPDPREQRAQTRVDKPLIVERDGERIVWKLAADEANQQLDGRMHLIRPVLTLYTESGAAVPIASDEAWFAPLKRHVVFRGHVEVRQGRRRLSCDRLIYDGGRDEIRVPGSFRAFEPGRKASGRNMRIDRRKETIDVADGIVIEDRRDSWPGHAR